jgi:hypothetical protein
MGTSKLGHLLASRRQIKTQRTNPSALFVLLIEMGARQHTWLFSVVCCEDRQVPSAAALSSGTRWFLHYKNTELKCILIVGGTVGAMMHAPAACVQGCSRSRGEVVSG